MNLFAGECLSQWDSGWDRPSVVFNLAASVPAVNCEDRPMSQRDIRVRLEPTLACVSEQFADVTPAAFTAPMFSSKTGCRGSYAPLPRIWFLVACRRLVAIGAPPATRRRHLFRRQDMEASNNGKRSEVLTWQPSGARAAACRCVHRVRHQGGSARPESPMSRRSAIARGRAPGGCLRSANAAAAGHAAGSSIRTRFRDPAVPFRHTSRRLPRALGRNITEPIHQPHNTQE